MGTTKLTHPLSRTIVPIPLSAIGVKPVKKINTIHAKAGAGSARSKRSKLSSPDAFQGHSSRLPPSLGSTPRPGQPKSQLQLKEEGASHRLGAAPQHDRWGGCYDGCRWRSPGRCCPSRPSSATTRGAACGRGARFMPPSACARRATTRARAAATLAQTAAAAPTPSSTRRRRPRTPRPCACTSGRPSPTARRTSPP